jgi:secreted PhoX family phosphatase
MKRRSLLVATVIAIVALTAGIAWSYADFGNVRDAILTSKTKLLFGIKAPLRNSSTESAALTDANADASALVTVAPGLHVDVVTGDSTAGTGAAPIVDMIALWPNDTSPTHLLFCNEGGVGDPGVQRLDLDTGAVDTIVTGTISCDPLHVTPWGTVVFGEENGGGSSGGRLYELIDPIDTTGVTLNRVTGELSGADASHIVGRPALGILSFEGVGVLPNGVVYYGDENRPGTGTAGGAYFKFVPSSLRDPSAGPIADLSGSPLASGSVYGLRLGKRNGNTDYGQGTEFGMGTWIAVSGTPVGTPPALDLRALAGTLKLTGYYRPEDLQFDLGALAAGTVRFCGNNTGNEFTDHLWGNTICITDGTVAQAGANTATPEAQLFVQGNPQFAMMDNVAYQPTRGNWLIHEDGDNIATGRNNDLWDCLPDGSDDDTLSDGCIRVATLNDLGPAGAVNVGEGAEWTGGVFDATGTHFYVSVQHNMTGHGVILDITGWKY